MPPVCLASAAERKAEDLQPFRCQHHAAADALEFDEATTRARLIDSQLASVGWDVGAGKASTEQVEK